MSKELSGFQKSVPSRFPSTREQNPVSAWDVDLSPFHRLVEEQNNATREMIDVFLQKVEGLVERVSSTSRQEAEPEKVLESQKKQTREYSELRKTLIHISEQLIEFQQLFQDSEDKTSILLENIGKQLSRPLTQDNKDAQISSQILAPIQKLVDIGQENFIYFENLREIKENQNLLIEKTNTIQHFLLQLGSMLQSQLPEKAFLEEKWNLLIEKQDSHFSQLFHYLEQTIYALETFNKISEKLDNIYTNNQQYLLHNQKEKQKQNQIENIAFFVILIAFAFLLFFFIFK